MKFQHFTLWSFVSTLTCSWKLTKSIMFRSGHFDSRLEGEYARVWSCKCESAKVQRPKCKGQSAKTRRRKSNTTIAPSPLHLRTFTFTLFIAFSKSLSIYTWHLMQKPYMPKVCRFISDIIRTHALGHRVF